MNEAASPVPRLATPSDDRATMNNNDCYVVGWGRNSWGGNTCVYVYSPAKEARINHYLFYFGNRNKTFLQIDMNEYIVCQN